MSLVLIDSSVWINLLRGSASDQDLARMQLLLETKSAAWCGMVQLELWSGVKDPKNRKDMAKLSEVVRSLEVTSDVWNESCFIAGNARAKGITVPATDILIYACANVHKVELWHNDSHFGQLAKISS